MSVISRGKAGVRFKHQLSNLNSYSSCPTVVFTSTIAKVAPFAFQIIRKEQDTHLLKPHQCKPLAVFSLEQKAH